jgi:hypothetical protein
MAAGANQGVQTGPIEADIPARLDRLPWSRFHRRVIIGLGSCGLLDGLEVTIVGSISARRSEHGAGVGISARRRVRRLRKRRARSCPSRRKN